MLEDTKAPTKTKLAALALLASGLGGAALMRGCDTEPPSSLSGPAFPGESSDLGSSREFRQSGPSESELRPIEVRRVAVDSDLAPPLRPTPSIELTIPDFFATVFHPLQALPADRFNQVFSQLAGLPTQNPTEFAAGVKAVGERHGIPFASHPLKELLDASASIDTRDAMSMLYTVGLHTVVEGNRLAGKSPADSTETFRQLLNELRPGKLYDDLAKSHGGSIDNPQEGRMAARLLATLERMLEFHSVDPGALWEVEQLVSQSAQTLNLKESYEARRVLKSVGPKASGEAVIGEDFEENAPENTTAISERDIRAAAEVFNRLDGFEHILKVGLRISSAPQRDWVTLDSPEAQAGRRSLQIALYRATEQHTVAIFGKALPPADERLSHLMLALRLELGQKLGISPESPDQYLLRPEVGGSLTCVGSIDDEPRPKSGRPYFREDAYGTRTDLQVSRAEEENMERAYWTARGRRERGQDLFPERAAFRSAVFMTKDVVGDSPQLSGLAASLAHEPEFVRQATLVGSQSLVEQLAGLVAKNSKPEWPLLDQYLLLRERGAGGAILARIIETPSQWSEIVDADKDPGYSTVIDTSKNPPAKGDALAAYYVEKERMLTALGVLTNVVETASARADSKDIAFLRGVLSNPRLAKDSPLRGGTLLAALSGMNVPDEEKASLIANEVPEQGGFFTNIALLGTLGIQSETIRIATLEGVVASLKRSSFNSQSFRDAEYLLINSLPPNRRAERPTATLKFDSTSMFEGAEGLASPPIRPVPELADKLRLTGVAIVKEGVMKLIEPLANNFMK